MFAAAVVYWFVLPAGGCLADMYDMLPNTRYIGIRHPIETVPKIDETVLRVSGLTLKPYTGIDQSTGRSVGLEIDLVTLLAEHIGMRPEIELSDNRTWLLKKLSDKQTDMLIGGLLANDNVDNAIIQSAMKVSSIPYVFDDMTWCVGTAKPQPRWMNIFSMFPLWMWFVLVLIGYVNSFLIYVMMQFEEPQRRWDYHLMCMMMFCSNLAMAYNGFRPQNIDLRLMYLYLLFYGMVIVATFNSFLINNLTQPIRWRQVDSVDMLLEQRMMVVGDREAFVLYGSGGENEMAAFVRQHFRHCPNIDMCLRQLADRDDLAVAVSRMYSRSTAYIRPSQMFCFPQTRGSIVNNPVRLLMRPGFLHVDRINVIIRRAFEAGLIAKWSADNEAAHGNLYGGGNDVQSAPVSDDNGNNVVLTMVHLSGAWITVCTCLPLSLLALIAEHLAIKHVRQGAGDGSRWHRTVLWMERVFLRPERSFFNGEKDSVYLE